MSPASDGGGSVGEKMRTPEKDEYTPAERRAIDRGIAQSEKEFAAGLGRGPFNTSEEFATAMEAYIKKLRAARRKAKSACSPLTALR